MNRFHPHEKCVSAVDMSAAGAPLSIAAVLAQVSAAVLLAVLLALLRRFSPPLSGDFSSGGTSPSSVDVATETENEM